MGGVEQGERALLARLGGGVVAQVRGEEGVDARGAHVVEEAVTGATADGDRTDRRVEVAADADALRGGGQPVGGQADQFAQGEGVFEFADPAESAAARRVGRVRHEGPVTRRSRAPASASETPGSARSALVCATCNATSFLIRVWTTRPLKVVAATVVVPRR